MSKIVCFGEVLWDVFPNYKKIGGAPLNVALRLKSFGNDVAIISAVGQDEKGDEIIEFIKSNSLDATEVQVSNSFKTSIVKVSLDNKGVAQYSIEQPCAWDSIKLTSTSMDKAAQSEAFIFGSLASRNNVSRETLFQLLEVANFKVFDVNLRAPHYTFETLEQLMNLADFIKFNDEELEEICEFYKFNGKNIKDRISFIARKTKTDKVCVTLGGDGAIFLNNAVFYRATGFPIEVVDTVGAGDSFLATLIHQILSNVKPDEALNYACAVGALVTSKAGANPKVTPQEINAFFC